MAKTEVSVQEYMKKHDESLRKIESLLSLSKKVLNINEVSRLTGLSKSTIYKFTYTGRIPFYKQAKHLFFDREEIENWLKSNQQKTVDEIKAEASTYLSLKQRRK